MLGSAVACHWSCFSTSPTSQGVAAEQHDDGYPSGKEQEEADDSNDDEPVLNTIKVVVDDFTVVVSCVAKAVYVLVQGGDIVQSSRKHFSVVVGGVGKLSQTECYVVNGLVNGIHYEHQQLKQKVNGFFVRE